MKALIAMSGGVDSSVAACLMKEKGFDCIGCTMKLYENEDACVTDGRTCCSLDDVEDARSVATRLGMPYYVFNFKEEFREKVICRFIQSYENGLTPNPCIDCNRYLKFDKLYERMKVLGCDYLVTGHYVRVEKAGDRYVLKKAPDETKDQSYVLYSLSQEQLAHTCFPLGSMTKEETRRLAEAHGFVNAAKPDSQDICFVPDGDYAKVIEHYTGKTYAPGNFVTVTEDGSERVLGEHKGIIHYTIGQRKGLGIAAEKPLYVCKICPEENKVVLGDNADLFHTEVRVKNVHWISGEAPEKVFSCKAKIRYRHTEQPCTVYVEDGDRIRIVFEQPQRAVTPGQAAVLYDGDIVLGGGTLYL